MPVPRDKRWLHKKYPQYPRWLVDFAIDYADANRNYDYLPLLLQYGTALLDHSEKQIR